MILNSLTKVAAAGAIATSLIMGKAVAEQASAPASVPAQFQGDWRVSLAECPPAITDRPVWVNASRIRMDHSVGEIRVIKDSGRRNVMVAGELLSDGDPRNAKLKLELSSSESELTISEGNWSVKLQRCPEEKTSK
jgi:hypothetical protein